MKIKYFKSFLRRFFDLPGDMIKVKQSLDYLSLEKLRNDARYSDKKCLIKSGYKVYSQGDEDGIVEEIFKRIGVTNRIFVEFGIGDGTENNTFYLLFSGWNGLWIEASKSRLEIISNQLGRTIASGRLRLVNAFINKDNINDLISSEIKEKEIDLLSIDIDGNDAHVFNAIECISPRVVVIEYNAKFPASLSYCMAYDENHIWQGDDNMGASLKYLEVVFRKKGYCLVGCNIVGTNAFFVREDLMADHFMEPYIAEKHYEPARYHLIGFQSGHRASLVTLDNAVLEHEL